MKSGQACLQAEEQPNLIMLLLLLQLLKGSLELD